MGDFVIFIENNIVLITIIILLLIIFSIIGYFADKKGFLKKKKQDNLNYNEFNEKDVEFLFDEDQNKFEIEPEPEVLTPIEDNTQEKIDEIVDIKPKDEKSDNIDFNSIDEEKNNAMVEENSIQTKEDVSESNSVDLESEEDLYQTMPKFEPIKDSGFLEANADIGEKEELPKVEKKKSKKLRGKKNLSDSFAEELVDSENNMDESIIQTEGIPEPIPEESNNENDIGSPIETDETLESIQEESNNENDIDSPIQTEEIPEEISNNIDDIDSSTETEEISDFSDSNKKIQISKKSGNGLRKSDLINELENLDIPEMDNINEINKKIDDNIENDIWKF